MAKYWLFLTAIVYSAILAVRASAAADEFNALREMYRYLNSPVQLKDWKLDGGNPCEEYWTGVECYRSSVVNLELQGLGLTGNLGFQLSSLRSLKHLNLSHNAFSGHLGDAFSGLNNLRKIDLSFNNFSGDLPTSFRSLTNLTELFLQSNQFTGSVVFLANLPLSDLNIQDNHFSGMIPEKFQDIHNLWIGGNKFDKETNYPPWNFPKEIMPNEQNISRSPAKNLSAIENHPSQILAVRKEKRPHTAELVLIVGGVTLIAACAALVIVVSRHRARITRRSLGSSEDSFRSLDSLPISTGQDYPSMADESPRTSAHSSYPWITPSRLPPIQTRTMKICRRKSFSKSKMSINAKVYTVAELQIATNNFSVENLLAEGSLGSLYRAEFPDGQILAVKNINTVSLSITEEEQFLDAIRNASMLRHPNIVTLLGYSMDDEQHLIVYEFIRNLSLEDVLHSIAYQPLSWGIRLRIAVDVAQALNYMHTFVMPPISHSNLKAANILLDEELMPHLCDCGLAVLRPLTNNNVKLKASEMAIADTDSVAREIVEPGTGNTKADVYAFGVLLLELFTGRRPLDKSRPKAEQSLVKWASSRLHDSASLGQMVDPTIAGTITSKSVSRFADIVSTCIRREKEFRPPMSEIVESLVKLQKRGAADDTTEADCFDRSFQSASTRFFFSPVSHCSV